jgi:hypothetical protein
MQTDVLEVRTSSIIKTISLMMKAVRTSETSVYFKETTRRCITEGYHLHNKLCSPFNTTTVVGVLTELCSRVVRDPGLFSRRPWFETRLEKGLL